MLSGVQLWGTQKEPSQTFRWNEVVYDQTAVDHLRKCLTLHILTFYSH